MFFTLSLIFNLQVYFHKQLSQYKINAATRYGQPYYPTREHLSSPPPASCSIPYTPPTSLSPPPGPATYGPAPVAPPTPQPANSTVRQVIAAQAQSDAMVPAAPLPLPSSRSHLALLAASTPTTSASSLDLTPPCGWSRGVRTVNAASPGAQRTSTPSARRSCS